MHRTIHAVLLALAAGTALAQVGVSARPGPADVSNASNAANPVPATLYRSAFEDYRPYADPEPRRWRDANEEMGRLNGHVGHVPGAAPQRGAPSAPAPASTLTPTPAHAGHGERK